MNQAKKDAEGRTPLHVAAQMKAGADSATECIAALLASGKVQATSTDRRLLEPICHALASPNVPRSIVDALGGPSASVAGGVNPLHVSAAYATSNTVSLLPSDGGGAELARSAAACHGGQTPLHAACMAASTEWTKTILAAGADQTVKDDRGYTAPMLAALSGARESIRALCEKITKDAAHGGKKEAHDLLMNVTPREGFSALHMAVMLGDVSIARMLAKQGGDDIIKLPVMPQDTTSDLEIHRLFPVGCTAANIAAIAARLEAEGRGHIKNGSALVERTTSGQIPITPGGIHIKTSERRKDMCLALKVSPAVADDEGPEGGGGNVSTRDWISLFDIEPSIPEPIAWRLGDSVEAKPVENAAGWIPREMEGTVREREGEMAKMIRRAFFLHAHYL